MCILQPVEVREGERWVRLAPFHEARFDFAIDFPHPIIGKQSCSFRLSREAFIEEIAPARTFGFTKELPSLRNCDLALGASLKNAIGLDEYGILNSEGLRFENEFVRHKIMDAMGDMMVIGHTILGHYSAFAASHKLNHLLTKKLLSSRNHYEIVSADQLSSAVLNKDLHASTCTQNLA
jgi:UDP-3-O-[3-hydroxymyristoyl] N-acetylglucosamine deacetylase